jgi:hypothetical protein
LNSKLHAVCDGKGRPLILLLSEGQMSDFGGAALMIDALPKTKALLGDTEHRAVLGAREDAQDMMPTGFVRRWQSERSKPASPQNQTENPHPARRHALPTTSQNRDHVRQAQRLAAHPHPL